MKAATPAVVLTGDGRVFQFPSEPQARQFEMEATAAGGEVVRLEPTARLAARPLYDLEQHLAALIDTEELVAEDQEQAYALELHDTLLAAVEKRDRVGQFMGWLESQAEFAHKEIARLKEREAFFTRALTRMEGYVSRVIESLGYDSKGKRKRLEGNTVTFSLHGCDKRVEVIDETAVPARYKRATITLPAELWEELMESLDLNFRDRVLAAVLSPKLEVSATLVKADLKAEVAVPGAKLAGGTYLVRK